ncbi:MAG: hypothetical protein ACR2PC_00830 [Tsuneonella suprasediminis]|uniref:Uncharacterized protein n=1 Tax=Tsuneonella suprasediminis TaxID=2306996 RepID=A0A419R0M9_9SPHN|nr:hypothetical protein [Tsuneonella suprasediminis]RJX66901.1 hypothetical protein D6858_11140 [Tsuneonella suprasediminis]UBS32281.1 hypothetical protein LBX01_12370 [Altererythrobacter sp. N1]
MTDPNRQDWVEDLKSEVSGMAKDGMHHPSTKPVLTGAAIGAVVGLFVPPLSWPLGLAAGAGIALYNRIKK